MDAIAPTLMTRVEAKRLGLKRYFTGKPCPNGHIALRDVGNKGCTACVSRYSKRSYQKNADAKRAYGVAYYWSDPEKHKAQRSARGKADRAAETARTREWLDKNPEKRIEYQRRYHSKNKAAIAGRSKDWRKKNVPKQRFYSSRRRAMEYAAIPIVPDDLVPVMQSEIFAIYAESRTTQELTGVRHAVDHIFPIVKGGVHAPWNLRVILHSENQSKKDKWPHDEPLMVMWHGLLVSRIKETE